MDQKRIGHQLIQKCVSWAGEKGARIIYTETGRNNEIAIKFYQKHDFQITGYIPDYYKKGLDAVILVKRLCSQRRFK
jgi:ribosomal protein S18 acetylase RimI-like enzyme